MPHLSVLSAAPDGGDGGGAAAVVLLLVAALGAALYFIPTIVAVIRHVPNVGSVAVVNIFLGWTFIGYVVALAMAFRSAPAAAVTNVHVQQPMGHDAPPGWGRPSEPYYPGQWGGPPPWPGTTPAPGPPPQTGGPPPTPGSSWAQQPPPGGPPDERGRTTDGGSSSPS